MGSSFVVLGMKKVSLWALFLLNLVNFLFVLTWWKWKSSVLSQAPTMFLWLLNQSGLLHDMSVMVYSREWLGQWLTGVSRGVEVRH